MPLYALDDVDDAWDVSRSFLSSLDRTAWLKLALVALFIAGPGANANSFQSTFGGNGGGADGGAGVPPGEVFGWDVWFLVAAAVGVLVLVALAFGLVGSVMEFVFVESLRNREVTVRRYWGRRWRQGVRLFVFRLVVGLFVFGSVLLFAAPFVLPLLGFDLGASASIGLLLLFVPLFVVLAVVSGLLNGFTTVFVVPIMILEDCGVLDGWRRLWPTVTAQWKQYLAYAVAGFFLSVVGGVLVGIVVLVGVLVLLIPFGVLFALGFGLLAAGFESVAVGAFVVVGVLFGLAVLAVAAVAQVPVQVYLRYYALLILGDVDPALDLVPEQRAAVREGSEATGE